MGNIGKPRKFEDSSEFIEYWIDFLYWVIDNGYKTAVSQINFIRYLENTDKKADRKTIYNYVNRYFPELKKEVQETMGDVISDGAMLGKYQNVASIFALKNKCNWKDKKEEEVTLQSKEFDALTKSLKEEAENM